MLLARPARDHLPYTRFDSEGPTGSGGRQQRCKAVLILVPSLVLASLALASSSQVAVMPQLRDEAVVLNATHTLPSPFCSPLRGMACGVRPITISTLVGMALGPLLVPLVFAALCCCGFGAAGVIAGSCAAGCQAPVTAKGGCFATLQSCGALGCCRSVSIFVLLAVAGGIIGMEVTGVCACDWPSPLEIAKTSTEWLAAQSRDVPVRNQLVTGWRAANKQEYL